MVKRDQKESLLRRHEQNRDKSNFRKTVEGRDIGFVTASFRVCH